MDSMPNKTVTFSFVVPLYNEAPCLAELHRQLRLVAARLGEPYEIIFVNDGSTDASQDIVRKLRFDDEHVRYISLSRNFGKHEAMAAGYDYSVGAAVVTLDADCQHPPEFIAEMAAKWRQGYDVVYTTRRNTDALPAWKRWTSQMFYRLFHRMVGMDLTDRGDFLLLDRKVVEALKATREKGRFTRGLIEWLGFKQVGMEYTAAPRKAGQSGYSFRKLMDTAAAAIFNFSLLPLRMIGAAGLMMLGVAILYAVFALILAPFLGGNLAANLVMLIIAGVGLQLTLLGIIGEYVGRIFEQVKNRPLYVVREAIGFDLAEEDEPLSPPRPTRKVVTAGPSKIRLFT